MGTHDTFVLVSFNFFINLEIALKSLISEIETQRFPQPRISSNMTKMTIKFIFAPKKGTLIIRRGGCASRSGIETPSRRGEYRMISSLIVKNQIHIVKKIDPTFDDIRSVFFTFSYHFLRISVQKSISNLQEGWGKSEKEKSWGNIFYTLFFQIRRIFNGFSFKNQAMRAYHRRQCLVTCARISTSHSSRQMVEFI